MNVNSILSGEEKNRIEEKLREEYKSIVERKTITDIFIPRIQYLIEEGYKRTIKNEELGIQFLDVGTYKIAFLIEIEGKKYVLKKYIYPEDKEFESEIIALHRGIKVYEKTPSLERLEYLHEKEKISIVNFLEGKILSDYRRKRQKIKFENESLEELAYTLSEMYSQNIFPLDANNDNNYIISPEGKIRILDYHLLDLEFLTKQTYDERKSLIPEATTTIKQMIRLIAMNDIGIEEVNYYENTVLIATRILPYIQEYFSYKGYKISLRPSDIPPADIADEIILE